MVTVGRTAFWGSYGNIVAAISAPGEREKWFGFLGALRNVGFALGGLVSGWRSRSARRRRTSPSSIANARVVRRRRSLLLLAVPPAPRRPGTGPPRARGATVLRDRPYRLLWLAQLVYSISMMVLNFAMPVYATHRARAARLGDRRGVHDQHRHGRLRPGAGRPRPDRPPSAGGSWLLANLVFAASFVVLLGASRRSVVLAVASWCSVGSVVYTFGELTRRPGARPRCGAEAAPEHLRGRYLSLIQLAWNLAGTVAPVTFAWLLDRGASPIWLALIALRLVGARARRPGSAG